MTERAFQSTVVELAKWGKWLVHAERAAINRSGRWSTPIQGHKGFCDLVMVRGSELIFAELKTDEGKLTAAQREWLNALQGAGVEAVIWRPGDLEMVKRRLVGRVA